MTAFDRRLIETALNAFRPPARPTAAEWAERTMRLPPDIASRPGPLRLTPIQRAILDAADDVSTSIIVLMIASQVGKSTAIEANILWSIVVDPKPTLLVYPTDEAAKRMVRTRLEKLIATNPEVRDLIGLDAEGRRTKGGQGGDALKLKSFPGGGLAIGSANKPEDLASYAAGRLYLDEIDRFPQSAGREGDPTMLAIRRTTTFADRKIFVVSTPTSKGSSRIADWFARGTMERYSIPCHDCGTFYVPEWEHVQWEPGKPRSAKIVCPHCAARMSEAQRVRAIDRGTFRRYDIDDMPCTDLLFRRGNVYALKLTGGGEPDRWSIYSQEAARQWLQDLGPDDDTLTVVG